MVDLCLRWWRTVARLVGHQVVPRLSRERAPRSHLETYSAMRVVEETLASSICADTALHAV